MTTRWAGRFTPIASVLVQTGAVRKVHKSYHKHRTHTHTVCTHSYFQYCCIIDIRLSAADEEGGVVVYMSEFGEC